MKIVLKKSCGQSQTLVHELPFRRKLAIKNKIKNKL